MSNLNTNMHIYICYCYLISYHENLIAECFQLRLKVKIFYEEAGRSDVCNLLKRHKILKGDMQMFHHLLCMALNEFWYNSCYTICGE